MPDVEWGKADLEMLISLVKEVMPRPDAQRVIGVCLLKACLATVSEELQAADIRVEHNEDEAWDNYTIDFEIDGTLLTVEVKIRE